MIQDRSKEIDYLRARLKDLEPNADLIEEYKARVNSLAEENDQLARIYESKNSDFESLHKKFYNEKMSWENINEKNNFLDLQSKAMILSDELDRLMTTRERQSVRY